MNRSTRRSKYENRSGSLTALSSVFNLSGKLLIARLSHALVFKMSQANDGFFKKFHDTVNSSLDDVTRNNFVNLETNAKRVSYLCSLPAVKSYDLAGAVQKCQTGGEFPVRKYLEKAKLFKDEGNKAVQKGDWGMAMALYSQSMVHIPKKECK